MTLVGYGLFTFGLKLLVFLLVWVAVVLLEGNYGSE